MPVGPSLRMRSLAARWLIDCVDLQTQTQALSTAGNQASGVAVTLGEASRAAALIRQSVVTDTDSATVNRAVRDLTIWVDDCVIVEAGMWCTVVSCTDSSLNGKAGTVLTVERDSLRAARRCMVRLTNNV